MIDPRMRRLDPTENADRAEVWAEILADVTLEDAFGAMRDHYATSTEGLLPAHIMDRCAPVDPWVNLPDITDEVMRESKLRALAAAGVTEAEFDAHEDDPVWLVSKFPPQGQGVLES